METHALSGIDLAVAKGEFVSVNGPSGCGKTTLLSLLGLLDTPSGGEYRLDGQSVDKLSRAERTKVRNRDIGFIFQSFNLIENLTVFENIELPLVYRGIKGEEARERVAGVLEKMDMEHRRNHYPTQLSGGQQQRIAVARAVVGSPKILLADEPTGNLDSANGDVVMDLLNQLHGEGATICMVTHDPRYADRAQRKVKLLDGKIID
ncbi:MAG: ABC transporter ATP-binding protein [Acidobacteriota bacterium]|nr:ABC transporter ATP-binding protein [Acidobacteriota bacterium]